MNHMKDSSPDYIVTTLFSLTIALVAGVLVTLELKPTKTETAAVTKTDELEIIKRALSDDEKAVLDEILRAGEITQDLLRFRLPKFVSILESLGLLQSNLNLIQRERMGKTYKVFIAGNHPKE